MRVSMMRMRVCKESKNERRECKRVRTTSLAQLGDKEWPLEMVNSRLRSTYPFLRYPNCFSIAYRHPVHVHDFASIFGTLRSIFTQTIVLRVISLRRLEPRSASLRTICSLRSRGLEVESGYAQLSPRRHAMLAQYLRYLHCSDK
jgi:hypothetical protein